MHKLLNYLATGDPYTRDAIDRFERGELSVEEFNKVFDELLDFE